MPCVELLDDCFGGCSERGETVTVAYSRPVIAAPDVEAAPATVRAAIREATGYEARFTRFPLMGLCPGCRADSSRTPEGRPHQA